MTSTTITAAETPIRAADLLMHLITSLLAPMFLGVAGGDINFARMAAIETVTDYRAQNQAGLIAVVQIIAFGLAALGSLSLSMADDISVNMALRLRSNANACNRSAEQNRRALDKSNAKQPDDPEILAAVPEDDFFLTPAAEQLLAAESTARLNHWQTRPAAIPAPPDQEAWAHAMVLQADAIAVTLLDLPPDERQAALMQIEALHSCIDEMRQGHATPLPNPA
jgi:hypothetical protein